MRKAGLLLLLVCGCGGEKAAENVGNQGSSPFYGTYNGTGYVNFVKTGPARISVQKNGTGVVTLNNHRGETEDWIVFVKEDGSYIGNQFGQTGYSEGVSGQFTLDGKLIVATIKYQWRTIGAVIRATKG